MKKFILSIFILELLSAGGDLYYEGSGDAYTAASAAQGKHHRQGRCYYECDPKYEHTASRYDSMAVEYHSHRDYANAILLHHKACTMKYAPACNHAGYMYDKGQGVAKDQRIARNYFTLACNYGSGIACSNLGVMYANGQTVEQNDRKALALYKKSCDIGSEEGCRNYKLLKRYTLITK